MNFQSCIVHIIASSRDNLSHLQSVGCTHVHMFMFKQNHNSYSYYCVINKKNVCCYLVSEIGILGNMRTELSFDD